MQVWIQRSQLIKQRPSALQPNSHSQTYTNIFSTSHTQHHVPSERHSVWVESILGCLRFLKVQSIVFYDHGGLAPEDSIPQCIELLDPSFTTQLA